MHLGCEVQPSRPSHSCVRVDMPVGQQYTPRSLGQLQERYQKSMNQVLDGSPLVFFQLKSRSRTKFAPKGKSLGLAGTKLANTSCLARNVRRSQTSVEAKIPRSAGALILAMSSSAGTFRAVLHDRDLQTALHGEAAASPAVVSPIVSRTDTKKTLPHLRIASILLRHLLYGHFSHGIDGVGVLTE